MMVIILPSELTVLPWHKLKESFDEDFNYFLNQK